MVRARRNNFSKTIKDYLVPIIGFVLVLIIIINSLSGDNNISEESGLENRIGIEATIDMETGEAFIEYTGEGMKKIEGNITFFPGEKILVEEGIVSMTYLPGVNLELNRLGELKYVQGGILKLFSSDLWINTSSKLNISMRYADVEIGEYSVVSLSQNEVGSTIYLLKGKVEVSNLVGKSTMLKGGQKITISRDNASETDIDLEMSKDEIDNFFKSSDWFIRNSGDLYLVNNEAIEENASTGSIFNSTSSLIAITSFRDEDRLNSSTLDIKGKYFKEGISAISINQQSAKVNEENKTFSLDGFSLENSINDIVFKVFDSDRNLIGKYVYTVYFDNSSTVKSNDTGFKVKTFNIDASGFKFTSPSTSTSFFTNDNFVTIKGIVPTGKVSKVVVNDYQLNSFNGSTWRYHARTDYNNLKEGTNVYEVKYYQKDGSLIYSNHYTIIKKMTGSSTKIISDEVNIN